MMGLQLKTTVGVELGGWVPEMLYLLYGLDDTQFYTNAMYCIVAIHSNMDKYDVLFGKGALYIITCIMHTHFSSSTPSTSTWDAVYGYEHHALSKQSYWTTAETQHPDPCFTHRRPNWHERVTITVEIKEHTAYAYICSESWCWYHILSRNLTFVKKNTGSHVSYRWNRVSARLNIDAVWYQYIPISSYFFKICVGIVNYAHFFVSSIIRPVDFLRQHQGTTSCSFTDLAENTSYVAVVQEKNWQHSLYGYRHCIQYRYTL